MLTFSNQVPSDPRGTSLPLLRCPPGKVLTAVVTSDDIIGTNTHYYHGRTLPCDDQSCPACDDGLPWRWHGYLSIWNPATAKQALFELTARAAEPFKDYRQTYGTLRGCMMAAKRANSAPNSKVLIHTKPADLASITLPEPPDVIAALAIIWNLSRHDCTIDGLQKDLARMKIVDRHAGDADGINSKESPGPNGRIRKLLEREG